MTHPLTKNEAILIKSMQHTIDKIKSGEMRLDPSIRPIQVYHSTTDKSLIIGHDYRIRLLKGVKI